MGFLAAAFSALFSASKDLLSKRLAYRLDGLTSTYASFAYALPFYLLVLAVLHGLGVQVLFLAPMFLLLVLLRAITDSFAEGMKMYAFAHGDISVVVMVFSISPLFLLVTSPLITRDPLTWPEVLAVVLSVGGSLILIYRPGLLHWHGQGKAIALAAGASFFFSLNSCFDRLAMFHEPTSTDAVSSLLQGRPVFGGFAMTLLSALFLLPLVLGSGKRRESLRTHRGGLLLRGMLEVAFMVCKLSAMQFLKAPDVVVIQRLSLLLSIVGGRVFFREGDFGRRLAAGVLIVAGAMLIWWWNQ